MERLLKDGEKSAFFFFWFKQKNFEEKVELTRRVDKWGRYHRDNEQRDRNPADILLERHCYLSFCKPCVQSSHLL